MKTSTRNNKHNKARGNRASPKRDARRQPDGHPQRHAQQGTRPASE